MISPFPIDICPLCKTELTKTDAFSDGYMCTNVVVNDGAKAFRYHYYVDMEHKMRAPGSYQNVIIPPFHFFSHSDENTTQVNKWSIGDWGGLIMEMPRIIDWSDPDKLISRIQTLAVFS